MTGPAVKTEASYLILADLKKPFSFEALFGNRRPVELEIGAGRGDFLKNYCEENPDLNLVAVERKLNYLMRGINKAHKKGLTNVQFLNLEVRHFLEDYVPRQSLRAVHIYHPDPWPKKRHLKRRLIQPDFVKLLAETISPGGELHLRTDHANYFEHMMEVMEKQGFFEQVPVPENIAKHKTGFEVRFTEQGVPIHYASYVLKNPPAHPKLSTNS